MENILCEYDVVVVGGGISGMAADYKIKRKWHRKSSAS